VGYPQLQIMFDTADLGYGQLKLDVSKDEDVILISRIIYAVAVLFEKKFLKQLSF
jgi:hypothetical protein